MELTTLLIFVVVIGAAFYIVRLIPDATIQKVLSAVVVIAALFWIIRNLHALLHCCRT
jgi:hypothetical protein